MYEMLPPRTSVSHPQPRESRAVSNVQVAAPVAQRYRAVVTRCAIEVAVVEFDATPGSDRWAMAKDLVQQIPATAWVAGTPGEPYIDTLETVTAPAAV